MTIPRIFDRAAYAARRRRAENSDSFLAADVGESVALRIAAVNRRFCSGLDLASRPQVFAQIAPLAEGWVRTRLAADGRSGDVAADEEALPFAPQSFDLVVSALSLHAVNDLPGALTQIARVLKPDGLFVAALFGGTTLRELRAVLMEAESDVRGGASPRVAPFADVRDLGGLLQRAGFALPVADSEKTTVAYKSLATLLADLRALGETNALAERARQFLRRDVFAAAIAGYENAYTNADGQFLATFEIVYLTGWSPHASQQKPLVPGSAKMRLADALGTQELPAGEHAGSGGDSRKL